MSTPLQVEIAAAAARWVVEEGLEYGPAKSRAARELGAARRSAWPDNSLVEQAVRDYIAVFCPDSQAQELAALRALASQWMERLAAFRPHLTGAVWHGTATRWSDIYLQLFCDDPKSAELALIDQGVRFQPSAVNGFQGEAVDALSLSCHCPGLGESVGIHLMIHDHGDLRGALQPDRQGRRPRGDLKALRALMDPQISVKHETL
ncbi:MAG: hypothetical protein EBQ82_01005 [Betaproteobacteria bacterium]|nr:hypothetical protein [Betaproteobacteria bacterium]NBY03992.1 hypothetical protein [Betaproteobacteria bacterium]